MSISRKNNRPAHVVIDRAAFQHNLQRVKELAPNSKVMAVIKADGYGHGLELTAHALEKADEFAVNSLDDVKQLRTAGIDKTITLLAAVLNTSELQWLSTQQVRPMIFANNQLESYRQLQLEHPLSVWLKVDTGMGRLGIEPGQLADIVEQLLSFSSIADISLMTHLANADVAEQVLNQQQVDLFNICIDQHRFKQLSVFNSAGLYRQDADHYNVVRPGLMLYGMSPLQGVSARQLNLKPVMTFGSELISVKSLPRGTSIGYGSTYTLEQNTRVGIVACGYGDGYPRHAPSGTPISVNHQQVELIGRVSMDMLAVDLANIDAQVGDSVILWGADNPIENIAAAATTISYELACGITSRVEKIVI